MTTEYNANCIQCRSLNTTQTAFNVDHRVHWKLLSKHTTECNANRHQCKWVTECNADCQRRKMAAECSETAVNIKWPLNLYNSHTKVPTIWWENRSCHSNCRRNCSQILQRHTNCHWQIQMPYELPGTCPKHNTADIKVYCFYAKRIASSAQKNITWTESNISIANVVKHIHPKAKDNSIHRKGRDDSIHPKGSSELTLSMSQMVIRHYSHHSRFKVDHSG